MLTKPQPLSMAFSALLFLAGGCGASTGGEETSTVVSSSEAAEAGGESDGRASAPAADSSSPSADAGEGRDEQGVSLEAGPAEESPSDRRPPLTSPSEEWLDARHPSVRVGLEHLEAARAAAEAGEVERLREQATHAHTYARGALGDLARRERPVDWMLAHSIAGQALLLPCGSECEDSVLEDALVHFELAHSALSPDAPWAFWQSVIRLGAAQIYEALFARRELDALLVRATRLFAGRAPSREVDSGAYVWVELEAATLGRLLSFLDGRSKVDEGPSEVEVDLADAAGEGYAALARRAEFLLETAPGPLREAREPELLEWWLVGSVRSSWHRMIAAASREDIAALCAASRALSAFAGSERLDAIEELEAIQFVERHALAAGRLADSAGCE